METKATVAPLSGVVDSTGSGEKSTFRDELHFRGDNFTWPHCGETWVNFYNYFCYVSMQLYKRLFQFSTEITPL